MRCLGIVGDQFREKGPSYRQESRRRAKGGDQIVDSLYWTDRRSLLDPQVCPTFLEVLRTCPPKQPITMQNIRFGGGR